VIATRYTNGSIDVWWFACDQDPGALAAALSLDEQAVAARFVAPIHRARYIAQHAMVRGLLARYLGVAPAAVTFTRGSRGKPAVAGLEHNLSHTDDVALLAVSRSIALGVDIERYAANIDPLELARTVLAPLEAACTERLAFFRIWCRKEACLKATGDGLVDDLTSISVIDDRVRLSGALVHLQDLALDADHAAALATLVPCAPIDPAPVETFTS
jgi:4'-phosphopantetheinyl transferase